MTAEIAVMNKSAVALAADSAVTIQTSNGQKIYNTVNKLFCLTNAYPVGIMVYGGAEVNGVPWETIIKEYREKLGNRSFHSVAEYGSDFIRFLTTKSRPLLEAGEDRYFSSKARDYLESLKNGFVERIDKATLPKKGITIKAIERELTLLVNDETDALKSYPTLKQFRKVKPSSIVAKHQKIFDHELARVFQKYKLTAEQRKRIAHIVGSLFTRYIFADTHSGIVIAGFGSRQHYPAIVQLLCEGYINGKLKWTVLKNKTVSAKGSVYIIPFAQSEMVETFMEGIDPILRESIKEYFQQVILNLPANLLTEIRKSGAKIPKSIDAKLKKNATKVLEEILANLKEYCLANHADPVVDITALLPKDELAAMAEALVNLTSFRRRVSLDAETVGGPIDVAVISKGDGFIWIKRKHYFKSELNPDFFARKQRHI